MRMSKATRGKAASKVTETGKRKLRSGRPCKYTPEIAADICSRITAGKSLKAICKSKNMPGNSTVFRWIANHPDFAAQYSLAMELRAHLLSEQVLEIAD